jgi:hypothetical protein
MTNGPTTKWDMPGAQAHTVGTQTGRNSFCFLEEAWVGKGSIQ